MNVQINNDSLKQKMSNVQIGIAKNNQKSNCAYTPAFKGPIDSIVTQSLTTLDSNPMANAAIVDIFSMVLPRTYVDTKERNKYAGAETFIREISSTIVVCLSAGVLAKGIAHLYNKFVNPDIQVNPDSWVSKDSMGLLQEAWGKGNNTHEYVQNIFENLHAPDGDHENHWKKFEKTPIEWLEDEKWKKFTWKDESFKNIHNELITKSKIEETLAKIIGNDVDNKDAKQILEIIEHRVANALGAANIVRTAVDTGKKDEKGNAIVKNLETSVHNLLRDTYDMGKNVFTNESVDVSKAIDKLKGMNKIKTYGALTVASTLGLITQYINRQITKKRTGTDAFVGDVDYNAKANGKHNNTKEQNKTKLWAEKLLSVGGILGLSAMVMGIRRLSDFPKKLEFTSIITSGNAIKTVYTATLAGRFLASKDETELRESTTRDYLGFLNWLVLGGFVSKGVAGMLEKEKNTLLNVNKEGSGIVHWFKNVSEKSHAEIKAKGAQFAKDNIWRKNLAQASGLVYSTIALGILLPLMNIKITKKMHEQKQNNEVAA